MCGGGGDNKVKDTPEQRHLAKVAAEKWNFSQEKLAPLEDQYMAHVDQMGSEANMSYIRGRTMQAQNQASGEASEAMHRGLSKAGIDPSSGRHQGTMNKMGLDLAEAGGDTTGRAQFEQDSQKIRGLQNVTAIGQGESGEAQAGLSRIAQESVSKAVDDAQKSFNRRSANLQLVGTVAGAGTRYGMQGPSNNTPSMADQNLLKAEHGYSFGGDIFG